MENKYLEQATAIAAQLGATVEQPEEVRSTYFIIVLQDGVRFSVGFDLYGRKGKLCVSSAYPSHVSSTGGNKSGTTQRDFDTTLSYKETGLGSILISMSKAPAVIAKDIERRYLREYRALYAKALEYCAKKVEYFAQTKDNEKAVYDALKGVSSAHVQYVTGNSAKLEIYIDADKAVKLATFLKSL